MSKITSLINQENMVLNKHTCSQSLTLHWSGSQKHWQVSQSKGTGRRAGRPCISNGDNTRLKYHITQEHSQFKSIPHKREGGNVCSFVSSVKWKIKIWTAFLASVGFRGSIIYIFLWTKKKKAYTSHSISYLNSFKSFMIYLRF